jgi:type IV pilus assembly protein PilO
VPIDIEFSGGFHDIATFFDQIARLPRIINISELDMSISKESSSGTLLKVEGKATTFRFVEPEPEPKLDPKASKGKGRPAAKGRAAQGGAR